MSRVRAALAPSGLALALAPLALAAPPSADPPVSTVVGGTVVTDNAWPDAAAVYFGNMVGCTGVLIAPRVALTAGHCAGGISKIEVGVDDYQESGEIVQVEEEYEYPNSWSNYDITALVLEEEAETEPRLIARSCILDRYLEDGAPVAIVGYGAYNTNGTAYDSQLREGFTEIGDADCGDLSLGCNRNVSPGGELTAGGDGVDSCFGDSGGPLYLLTEEGDFLVGITSRAVNGAHQPCGDGGIYARPDAVYDWIEEETGIDLPDVDCDTNEAPAPSAAPITVTAGETATTLVHPNDPDAGDGHTFAVEGSPALGEASVDAGGVVTYTAEEGVEGQDEVVVRVTDDATPSASATVTIPVTVEPEPAPDDDASDDDASDDDASDDDDEAGGDDDGAFRTHGCACGSGGRPPGAVAGTASLAVALLAGVTGSRRRRR